MSSSSNSPLDASVLVLNKLYMAVLIVSVRRAICLLCKDAAEVISLEEGQFATYDFSTWRELSEFRARHFPNLVWRRGSSSPSCLCGRANRLHQFVFVFEDV